jgi:hypothetical protein
VYIAKLFFIHIQMEIFIDLSEVFQDKREPQRLTLITTVSQTAAIEKIAAGKNAINAFRFQPPV